MRLSKSTCASTISALALATIPGDRESFEPTPDHKDFRNATGYLTRTIGNERCHALDWDGRPGVDSILREGGRRSGALWREFREWRALHHEGTLREAGTKACETLLKHFGPYDRRTAEALAAKRRVHGERLRILKELDERYPASVRCAAREYLVPQVALAINAPSFPSVLGISNPAIGGASSNRVPRDISFESEAFGSLSRAEHVLREHMGLESDRYVACSVEDFAKEVLAQIRPVENELDMLDVQEGLMRLPSIPGEGEPADMDRIPFGSLICRHRAVVVAILLADGGFDVEVVRGTVEQEGRSGGHLFVYAASEGILEPSADGPEFWRAVVAASEEEGKIALKVQSGGTYRFEHRTRVTAR